MINTNNFTNTITTLVMVLTIAVCINASAYSYDVDFATTCTTAGTSTTCVTSGKVKETRCFPIGTLVNSSRGAIPIEDLHQGDLLLTSDGQYKPFRGWLHRVMEGRDYYVVIHTSNGNQLWTSPEHLVAVNDSHTFVQAQYLTTYDHLITRGSSVIDMMIRGHLHRISVQIQRVKIVSIEGKIGYGYLNPNVLDGTFFANGFLVSSLTHVPGSMASVGHTLLNTLISDNFNTGDNFIHPTVDWIASMLGYPANVDPSLAFNMTSCADLATNALRFQLDTNKHEKVFDVALPLKADLTRQDVVQRLVRSLNQSLDDVYQATKSNSGSSSNSNESDNDVDMMLRVIGVSVGQIMDQVTQHLHRIYGSSSGGNATTATPTTTNPADFPGGN